MRLIAKTMPEAAARGIYAAGEVILADATERTPVDTGRLRSSGYCAPPRGTAGDYVVEVGFGTDYAPAVHEKTEVHHAVGEAKFLEKAIQAQAKRALQVCAQVAERFAAKGGEPTGPWPERPSE